MNYLKTCQGCLGDQADEELVQMRKTCAAIMGFVHNHPEQLPRVRRYREYYMPTTRKLLNTALGLGESATQNAQEIWRDIVGILHTLNTAYEKAVRYPFCRMSAWMFPPKLIRWKPC